MAVPKAISAAGYQVGDDRLFMVVGPQCWGKGVTVDVAIRNAKSHWPWSGWGDNHKWWFVLFDVHPDTTMNQMGQMVSPNKPGAEPRELAEYRVPRGVRS